MACVGNQIRLIPLSKMQTSLNKSANQFAADLFLTYLRRHGDKYKNLLLCPYLIFHSLAMMLVGARGETAEQLMKLLRIRGTEYGAKISTSSSSSSSSGRQPFLSNCRPRVLSPSASSLSSISSAGSTRSASSIALPSVSYSQSLSNNRQGSNHRSKSPYIQQSNKRELPDESTEKSANKVASLAKSTGNRSANKHYAPDEPDLTRHKEFLLLSEQLLHGNHEFVHLASFIYLDKGTKRTESFKTILRDFYETKPKKIDFDNVDLMVTTINDDVARTTENIYNDILSRQEAQKLEKSYMLLVNAVFFRGFWLSNFTDVKRSTFTNFSSSRVARNAQKSGKSDQVPKETIQFEVNMMSKLDYLPIVKDNQLEAGIVKMPFEASDLQMLIILPNNPHSDPSYLSERLSASKIDDIFEQLSKAKNRTVRISMPIFCIDSGKISIQSTLITMGANDLFDKTKANMSGVCENKQVWLHKIIHRCFIICDNRGAITSSSFEKARKKESRSKAESGISFGRKGVEEFIVNHPFMYIIVDSITRTILLMGLYTDPSETLEVIHENQLSPEEAHQIYTEGVYKT